MICGSTITAGAITPTLIAATSGFTRPFGTTVLTPTDHISCQWSGPVGKLFGRVPHKYHGESDGSDKRLGLFFLEIGMNKVVVASFAWVLLAMVVLPSDVLGQDRNACIKRSAAAETVESEDQAVEDESVEDESVEDESVEDESVEDGAVEDKLQPAMKADETPLVDLSPCGVLSMATTERTPQTISSEQTNAPTREDSVRIGKVVTLESDRFAHRALLFEEPLHERYGIANRRPVAQTAKSTAVFFGKAFIFPATALTRRHLECESGAGYREAQGNRICAPPR